jgi:hypothetical protein
MPHQVAVRSGVIHPKYPAAPRQWVTYAGDAPSTGGAVSTPNLSSGAQRDFSRRWGGDAESKFPRLDSFARAATIGALGKVLSQGIQDLDDDDQQQPPAGRLPSPYGMTGPGTGAGQQQTGRQSSPYGGQHAYARTMPSATGELDESIPDRRYASEREVPDTANAIGGMKALNAGNNVIDADSWETAGEIGSTKGLDTVRKPGSGATSNFIDVDSWEVAGELPGQRAIGSALEMPQQGNIPALSSFVSPALRNQQSSINKRRRGAGMAPNALSNIRKTLAEFEGF